MRVEYLIVMLFYVKVKGSRLKGSLVFVIDNTNSMGPEVDEVISRTKDLFDAVYKSNSSSIDEFILATFNDPDAGVVCVTKDYEEYMNSLETFSISGGGDCPEFAMKGIYKALEKSKPNSFVYVFTDASAKDFEMLDKVKSLSQKKSCQVTFLLTGSCEGEFGWTGEEMDVVYNNLAEATSGQVYRDLKKYDIHMVIEYIIESIKSEKTLLAHKILGNGKNKSLTFKVDSKIQDVMISAAGKNPDFTIIDAKGNLVEGETIVHIPRSNVLKFIPTSNFYTLEITNDEEASVLITGSTIVVFEHGFSFLKPKSLEDTSTKPIPGEKNYLSIALTNEERDVKLESLELIDMHDNVIMKKLLQLINVEKQFYSTESFISPNVIYKIRVNGYINDIENLTRIGHITIEAHSDQAITIPYNSSDKIKCEIHSSKPISWYKGNTKISTKNRVMVIKSMKPELVGIYSCRTNEENSKSWQFILKISGVVPTVKIIGDTKLNVDYNSPVSLKCEISGYPEPDIIWKDETGADILSEILPAGPKFSYISTLKIPNVEQNKTYYCQAFNEIGTNNMSVAVQTRETTFSKVITVPTEKPRIDKSKTSYIVRKGERVDLACRIISGIPTPSIFWFKIRDTVFSRKLNVTGDTYSIVNTKPEDAGDYKCIANNSLNKDVHEINLLVTYPPTVKVDKRLVIAKVGEELILICRVDGQPFPAVQWLKNDKPLLYDSRFHVYRDYSLRFIGNLEDNGNYTCEASSATYKAQETITVSFYTPVVINSPERTTYVLKVGGSLDMECQADGDPKPEVKWTFYSYDTNIAPKEIIVGNPSLVSLRKVQIDNEGYYRCTASNIGGNVSLTYTVNVTAPTSIAINPIKLKPVVGDVVLRIPCKAIGNPKPEITWICDGINITKGTPEYDIEDDGTLLIKKLDTPYVKVYTCQAKNELGPDYITYEVEVLPCPELKEPPPDVLLLEAGQSIVIDCQLPYKEGDKLNWFKDGSFLLSGELELTNVKVTDSGNYSCRVTTYNSTETEHLRIRVTMEPVFLNKYDRYINFTEGEVASLDCIATAVPKPVVVWTRNTRRISISTMSYNFTMTKEKIAQYECTISNKYGKIKRVFEIKTEECSVNIYTDFHEYQPLLLSYSQRWPHFEKSENFIKIPKHRYFNLMCPGTHFSNPEIKSLDKVLISCLGNSLFTIKDTKEVIEFSKIRCQEKIRPVTESFGAQCIPAQNEFELFHVGFNLDTEFVGIYEICYDRKNNIALYTKLSIDKTISNVVLKDDPNFARPYIVEKNSTKYWSSESFSHKNDECSFRKRQLVNPRDVLPGLSLFGTDNFMNLVPHWSTCNTENWEELERRIRFICMSFDYKLVVWAGTSQKLTLPSNTSNAEIYVRDESNRRKPVPKFLWKVIKDLENEASLAIIQVNIPHLTESEAIKNVLCEDICDKIEWMKNNQWRNVTRGFTYCCNIIEFEAAFNYTSRFGIDYKTAKTLGDISKVT